MFRTLLISGKDNLAAYRNRVLADGGSILNASDSAKVLTMLSSNQIFDKTLLLMQGWGGIKTRVSGVNSYVSKAYSAQLAANDLSQTTELSQPWLSGNIAPNEKYCLKNPKGSNRLMTFPAQTFTNSQPYSFTWMGSWDGSNATLAGLIGKGSDTKSNISFRNADTNRFGVLNEAAESVIVGATGGTNSLIGKNSVVHFISDGAGNLAIYKNGVLSETLTGNFGFVFSQILMSYATTGTVLHGRHHYKRLQSGAMTQSQITAEYNTLRSIVPERESVIIGSQAWTTSNLDIACDAAGVVIPEVTDNTAWAALTTPAWCHYNNDPALGAIYGKLYNWYAVKQIDDALAAVGSEWRVPTQAQLNTLATTLGGASVAGGKMKVAGTSYWTTQNTGATNESGFTALGSGSRSDVDGSFGGLTNWFLSWGITESASNAYRMYASNSSTNLSISLDSKKMGRCLRLVKTL